MLGSFTWNGYSWTGAVQIPAFFAFSYNTGYAPAATATDSYELEFFVGVDGDAPAPAAINVATRILENQSVLVATIAQALWDDLHGDGRQDSKWRLDEMISSRQSNPIPTPTHPHELLRLLKVCQIMIAEPNDPDRRLVADISFHTDLDPEHGLSILTDGQAVFGIGSMGEASLYE